MSRVEYVNLALQVREPSRALVPRRRRLSTVVARHAPAGRPSVPLVFRGVADWREVASDKSALDAAVRTRAQYASTLVGPRDVVVFLVLPLGGGGSAGGRGKSAGAIGLTLAAIALTALAGPAGATVGGGLLGTAVQGGLVVAGVALAAAAQKASAAKKKDTAFYGLSGGGNLPRPSERRPLWYGKRWSTPPLSQKDFFIYTATGTTLFKRMTLGLGEYHVHQVRLGESLLWDELTGVQAPFNQITDPGQSTVVEVLYEQPSLVMGADIISSSSVQGQSLPRPGENPSVTPWFRMTPQGVNSNYVIMDYQYTSLTRTSSAGRPVNAAGGVIFTFERLAPLTGDPTGETYSYPFSVFAYSQTAVHQTMPINLPSSSEWRVRASNQYPAAVGFDQSNDVTWDAMSAFLPDTRSLPKTTEMVVRIAGTKGLPITSTSDVQVLATRKIPVWTGTAWSAPQTTTRAVWAYADLVRNEYGLSRADAVDASKLQYYADRADIADFGEFSGEVEGGSSFWEAASRVLAPLRAQPVKIGEVYSIVRDESAAEAGGRRVLTGRQIVRGSGSEELTFKTEDSVGGDIIVEYLRDGDPKTPDEVRQDKFPTSRTPKRYKMEGVTQSVHALHMARWLAAVAFYRGTTRKVTTEWDGRLLLPGTHLLCDIPYLSEISVSGVDVYPGGTSLVLDAPLTVAAGATYVSVRTRAGREWGILRATYDGDLGLVLNVQDVSTCSGLTGLALADVIARDYQEPTTISAGQLELIRDVTWIVKSSVPRDVYAVDVEMELDDARVWTVLGEAIAATPAPAATDLSDPEVPDITSVHARCVRIETSIEMVWSVGVARGAVSYSAQLSYDAGATWEVVQERMAMLSGRVPLRESTDPILFQARAFGKTGLYGAWRQVSFTTVSVQIPASAIPDDSVLIGKLDQAVQDILTGTGPNTVPGAQTAADAARAVANDTQTRLNDLRGALSVDPAVRAAAQDNIKYLRDDLENLAKDVQDAQEKVNDNAGRLVEIGVVKNDDGVYRLAGVAQLDGRINTVNLSISALDSRISQLATTFVSGDFSGLITQITQVGQDLDALEGTLTDYVKQADFSPTLTRVTSLETSLSAAQAAISLKASQAVVTDLVAQVSAAQVQVSALSGVVLTSNIGVLAADNDARDVSLEYVLSRLQELSGTVDQTFGQATTAISARFVDNERIVAEQRTILTAAQGTAAANYTALNQAIATVDSAQTIARQTLAAAVNDPTTGLLKTRADLATESQTRADADSANASLLTGLQAQIVDPNTGLAKTRADLAAESVTRANADGAFTSQLTSLQSVVFDSSTGLAQTRADYVSFKQTQATQNSSVSSQLTSLSNSITGVANSLSTVSSNLTNFYNSQADTNAALSSSVSALTTNFNNNAGSVSSTLSSLSNSVTVVTNSLQAVSAQANGATANGSIYFSAEASVGGDTVAAYRLRLQAGGVFSGLTVLADNAGGSRILLDSDKVAIGDAATGRGQLVSAQVSSDGVNRRMVFDMYYGSISIYD